MRTIQKISLAAMLLGLAGLIVTSQIQKNSTLAALSQVVDDAKALEDSLSKFSSDSKTVPSSLWTDLSGRIETLGTTLKEKARGPEAKGLSKTDAEDMDVFVQELIEKLKKQQESQQLSAVIKSVNELQERVEKAEKTTGFPIDKVLALITALAGLFATISNVNLAKAASRREDLKLERELDKDKKTEGQKKKHS